jgi:hypothetical protein
MVTIRPFHGYGTTKLMRNNKVIESFRCGPDNGCVPGVTEAPFQYSPPKKAADGVTLSYVFECIDDPATLEINECDDTSDDGSTIQIDYETFQGP